MRILFLQKTDKFSGAENVVLSIMSLLPKSEYETIYASLDGPIREDVKRRGLRFYALKHTNVKAIKKAIKELKPDIIHATDFGMSVLSVLATKKIPVISHIHNNALWIKNPFYPKNIAYAFALSRIKHTIVVSDSIEREFFYRFMFKKKVTVLNNFVDAKRVKRLSEVKVTKKKYQLIFVGRLSEEKSPLLFCKIVNKIRVQNNSVKTCLVGEGKLKSQVETYIKKHRLEDSIDIMGFQENPFPYILNSKILVMPSKYEGFGLTAVESMILGKPVVCSGVGGLSDIVDENCGKICMGVEDYIQEITKLLKNKEYYNKKSQLSIEKSTYFTNENKYIDELEKIYNDIKR